MSVKIAIHHRKNSFSGRWIKYCRENSIDYKLVDCYGNDIINELEDCDALMWHFHHNSPKDVIFAKQLLYALSLKGLVVFPSYKMSFLFDDKIAQKYVSDALGIPLVDVEVFYDRKLAQAWIEDADYPKVFKLRRGAGSDHVYKVNSKKEALIFVKKMFNGGMPLYAKKRNIKERWREYKNGRKNVFHLLKGMLRVLRTPDFDRIIGPEKGYVYFQKFVPYNRCDVRIVVVANKAFAIKRLVRKGDFRASGSGLYQYQKKEFSNIYICKAFQVANLLNSDCVAVDFVSDQEGIKILEFSFGFSPEVYDKCEGFWDRELNWYEGAFNPQGWMVESVVDRVVGGNKIVGLRD